MSNSKKFPMRTSIKKRPRPAQKSTFAKEIRVHDRDGYVLLDLSSCGLTALKRLLAESDCENVVELVCRRNNLGTLIENGTFFPPNVNFDQLTKLDLSHNSLTCVGSIFHSGRLPSLNTLSLAHNKLSSLQGIQKLKNIMHLNLAFNLLKGAGCLQKLSNLVYLDMSSNCITFFSDLNGIEKNNKLEYLYLQHNPLAHRTNYFPRISRMLPFLVFLDEHRLSTKQVPLKVSPIKASGQKKKISAIQRQARASAALAAGGTINKHHDANTKRRDLNANVTKVNKSSLTSERQSHNKRSTTTFKNHEIENNAQSKDVKKTAGVENLRRYKGRVENDKIEDVAESLEKNEEDSFSTYLRQSHTFKNNDEITKQYPFASKIENESRKGRKKSTSAEIAPSNKTLEKNLLHVLGECDQTLDTVLGEAQLQDRGEVPESLDALIDEKQFEEWNSSMLQQIQISRSALTSLLKMRNVERVKQHADVVEIKLKALGIWDRMTLPPIVMDPSDDKYLYSICLIQCVEFAKALVRKLIIFLKSPDVENGKVQSYINYVQRNDPVSKAMTKLCREMENWGYVTANRQDYQLKDGVREFTESSRKTRVSRGVNTEIKTNEIDDSGVFQNKEAPLVSDDGNSEEEKRVNEIANKDTKSEPPLEGEKEGGQLELSSATVESGRNLNTQINMRSKARSRTSTASALSSSIKFRMHGTRPDGVNLPEELIRMKEERLSLNDNESVASSVWSIEGQASVKKVELDIVISNNNSEQEVMDDRSDGNSSLHIERSSEARIVDGNLDERPNLEVVPENLDQNVEKENHSEETSRQTRQSAGEIDGMGNRRDMNVNPLTLPESSSEVSDAKPRNGSI